MHVLRIERSQKVAFSMLHQSVFTSREMNSVEGGEEEIEGEMSEGWRYLPLWFTLFQK